MTAARRVTISISIPTVVHILIGAVAAVAAISGFVFHHRLDPADPSRGTALGIGVTAGVATLAYWLWCTLQRSRAEAVEHDERVTARFDEVTGAVLVTLREISAAVEANGHALKDLDDAVTAATGAVEALQDTYLREGRPPC